jgi:trimeric autotransporter adhesin
MESMEERVLLSTADLTSLAAARRIGAEVLRIKKSPTQLTAVSASEVKGGTAKLMATLTSNGSPLAGEIIRFQIGNLPVGRATTDAHGVAILSNVNLKGLRAGIYPFGVVATFAGDANHKSSASRGRLTVSRFATSLSGVSASGVYGGSGTLTATLTSNSAPLSGQVVRFLLNGQNVGSATTDNQGVATLANVSLTGINAGVYANAVTASFAGGVTYQQNVAGGTLTVSQAQAIVNLGGLTQTYDGSPKSVTVTTSPSGLANTVAYTDAIGNPVASPSAAGSYHVTATITDPNHAGSATGILVIAPAQISVSVGGITASNKVYDGTTDATLNTGSAALVGVAPGDGVTLVTSNAKGTFASKDAGTGKVVTVSGLSLSGAAASNYVLVQPTTTADITAATLTGSITASNKVYDGTVTASVAPAGVTGVISSDDVSLVASKGQFAAATATVAPAGLTGVIGSDVVSLVASNGQFADKNVGVGKTVTADLSLAGTDAGNYVLSSTTASTTADITAAHLTVGSITASDKEFDDTADATIIASSLDGVFGTDDVSLTVGAANFATSSPGTWLVTAANLGLTGTDAVNYVLDTTSTTTTATITSFIH